MVEAVQYCFNFKKIKNKNIFSFISTGSMLQLTQSHFINMISQRIMKIILILKYTNSFRNANTQLSDVLQRVSCGFKGLPDGLHV